MNENNDHNTEQFLLNPMDIKEVVLGKKIRVEELVAVARYGAKVSFSDEYIERVKKCRAIVEDISNRDEAVYGITTGLGENWKRKISLEDREIVQRNNLRSHACSLGEPIEEECVRAIMFVLLQHLGTGYSGIRIETLNVIKELLNKNVIPFVPRHGSVGYLCLEAHVGLVVIGEGKAYFEGSLYDGEKALELSGINPTTISSKEGLSLTSGTTSVTALASLGLYDALVMAKSADIIGAMSLEVLKGTLMAMDDRIMRLRPHVDQGYSAENIRNILAGSEIIEKYKNHRVQDALSLRSMPQLHGAAKKTIKDSLETLTIELNSSVDNPLIFEEDGYGFALMGCNADGTYVGLAADITGIAVTNIAKMSERRLDRLVNPHLNELPPFLNINPGLNNGLMIPQYAAAGIMGQIKILAHPSTIDNFVTCANQEDYVSMGYNAARKLYEICKLAKYIFATEIFNSCQAQDFYTDIKPSLTTCNVKEFIRKKVPFISEDSNMSSFIEEIADMLSEQKFIKIVEEAIGELKF